MKMHYLFWFVPLVTASDHSGHIKARDVTVSPATEMSPKTIAVPAQDTSITPSVSSCGTVSTASVAHLHRPEKCRRCHHCHTSRRRKTAHTRIQGAPYSLVTTSQDKVLQTTSLQITTPLTSPLTVEASTTLSSISPSTPSSPITTFSASTSSLEVTLSSAPTASPSSTASHSFKLTSPVDVCYETQGGVQVGGDIAFGCGAMLAHMQSCHDSYTPGDNLANSSQNLAFQTCFCKTSKDEPFDSNNLLFKNFTGCAQCLLSTKVPSFDFVAAMLDHITNFCRSQNPFPWTFYVHLTTWFSKMRNSREDTSPEPPPLTGDLDNAFHFTTMPPLANLAYGASAPSDGSLAGVTPSLTTFTAMKQNPKGCCALPATITSLVEWIPTNAGKKYDSNAAASSENQAASQSLKSALCDGRGPGQCGDGSLRTARDSWWLLLVCVVGATAVLHGLI